MNLTEMNKLILGSGSPRRAQLLKDLCFQFQVRSSDIEELFEPNKSPDEVARSLANQKNQAIKIDENETLLTADTIVAIEDQILGKPADMQEAMEMLQLQSGKVHQVITGVSFKSKDQQITRSELTEVKFKSLSEDEIRFYVETFKPFDKAGAYGIQEWIGQMGIEWIKGSYYNVVGLPTDLVYEILTEKFDIYPDN